MAETHPLLVWNEAFSLGVPQIDADHKALVASVNRLGDLAADDDRAAFSAEVMKLHDHLRAHFVREEELLRRAMPETEAEAHCNHHRATDRFFSDLWEDKPGGAMRLPRETVVAYLHRWLLDHVLVGDASARDRLADAGLLPRTAAAKHGVLGRFRIGARVWMAAAVPLLLLAAAAGRLAWNEYGNADVYARLSQLSHIAAIMGDAAHDLQKERGASAGFLNSQGKQFGGDVTRFRQESDASIAAMNQSLAGIRADALTPHVAAIGRAVGDLTALRTRVDSFAVPVAEEVAAYTGAIREIVDGVAGMAALSPDEGLAGEISAFSTFLRGKDLAGIERATGSAGFGAGAFSPALFRNFIALAAAQDAYFTMARAAASPESADILAKALAGPAETKVAEMRKIVGDSLETRDLKGVTGPQWFAAATQRIDSLKAAENAIAGHFGRTAADAAAASRRTALAASGGLVALMLAVTGLIVVIIRSITRPIGTLRDTIATLSDGDTTVAVSGQDRQDEIGLIARAVHTFRQNLIRGALADASKAVEVAIEAKRGQTRERLTNDFRASMDSFLAALTQAAEDLQAAAHGMERSAGHSRDQAVTVASAATEASQSVDAVAAAAEELAASIGEIAQQVSRSTEVSRVVADSSESAQSAMSELADCAVKIGDVIGLINDIASQTNLLALNATIEAARAGDMGKGFAVVAGEVKILSGQTESATRDIANQVGAVQTATKHVVNAIESVTSNIQQMSEIAGTIAGAIEEQRAATEEISMSVVHAAGGTRDVTEHIAGVAEDNDRIGEMSKTVSGAAQDMASRAHALRMQVENFLRAVAAA